ncbi:ribosome maturation factor RimM [Bacterioplanes sanyensis]|uniref:ribosome maturation factor RimM n=1 Tax=Bacterioplanes sanyensis TaxID=1249553 RepID=UPI001673AA8F|nr:ribosome maturation factor RimM [Bacterioplanes sanyensis]GGY54827.1 ribosome maturation factor RimM [Bacterioplanes sanyensis]
MSTQHAAEQDITVLGKVTTAFGVKGWVKVYSYTDPMTSIFDYPSWLLNIDGQWRSYKVRDGKPQGKGLVAALEGVNDRDAAVALSQIEIAVPTSELPELDEDEHYWFQLQGLKVFHTDGQLLGQVKELFDSGGGNQVMVISSCAGSIDSRQRMVPFVGAIVLSVDLDEGQIQVDWEPDF